MKASIKVLIIVFALLVFIIFGIVLYDAVSKTSTPSIPSSTTSSSTSPKSTTSTSSKSSASSAQSTPSGSNIDKVGLCPFGTCDKFDAKGNCIPYPSGAYHCHLDKMTSFNGYRSFRTPETPNTKNAVKMCKVNSAGQLVKTNGQYTCNFNKGNTFGNDRYLNVFPEDLSKVKNPIDGVGLCPFGKCDKFDAKGNCIPYSSGAYHCHVNTLTPFNLNGKKAFHTSDTPITKNAVKMCKVNSAGELVKTNGQYTCTFNKGNTFGNNHYLNVFPQDLR